MEDDKDVEHKKYSQRYFVFVLFILQVHSESLIAQ